MPSAETPCVQGVSIAIAVTPLLRIIINRRIISVFRVLTTFLLFLTATTSPRMTPTTSATAATTVATATTAAAVGPSSPVRFASTARLAPLLITCRMIATSPETNLIAFNGAAIRIRATTALATTITPMSPATTTAPLLGTSATFLMRATPVRHQTGTTLITTCGMVITVAVMATTTGATANTVPPAKVRVAAPLPPPATTIAADFS